MNGYVINNMDCFTHNSTQLSDRPCYTKHMFIIIECCVQIRQMYIVGPYISFCDRYVQSSCTGNLFQDSLLLQILPLCLTVMTSCTPLVIISRFCVICYSAKPYSLIVAIIKVQCHGMCGYDCTENAICCL